MAALASQMSLIEHQTNRWPFGVMQLLLGFAEHHLGEVSVCVKVAERTCCDAPSDDLVNRQ
jgi:hypothetical protein